MMFNPFNTGGRGIASLIQPLLMGIGSQINQSTNTQLNDFGQKVEQLASESFPELEMNQPMGMQVARPIQAQNRDRFLSMFSPQTRPQTRPLRPLLQDGPALATPEYFPMIPGGEQYANSTVPSLGVRSFGDLNPERDAQLYPNNPLNARASMGIRSLAQMLPRAT